MKTRLFAVTSLLAASIFLAFLAPGSTPTVAAAQKPAISVKFPSIVDHARVSAALKSTPVMFIENTGQFADGARFQVRGRNGSIYLADDAIWYTTLEHPKSAVTGGEFSSSPERIGKLQQDEPGKVVNLKLSFVGANPHPRLEPFDRIDTRVSYFTGSDPTKWRSDVPVWTGVRYLDLYPGVDLEVTGAHGQIQQRLRTHANANLATVQIRLSGDELLKLRPDSSVLQDALGLGLLPSGIFGTSQATSAAPATGANGMPEPFTGPPSAPEMEPNTLPLTYSTFLGGNIEDESYAIAVDKNDAAYVTGTSCSIDFPTTTGVYDETDDGCEAFVVKLDPSGSSLIYATFLGGNSINYGQAIAVDENGAAYIAGSTDGVGFPATPNAFDTTFNGGAYDVFVAKLNPTATALEYATLLGGNKEEHPGGIALSSSGKVFVAGSTQSKNFPVTASSYDTSFSGSSDIFVAKIDASGASLEYGTFIGGQERDGGGAIAVDPNDYAYITGYTDGGGFPTTSGAFDRTFNGLYDAFVLKLNRQGSALVFSTLLGGLYGDGGAGIALDSAGFVYVSGTTTSPNFPTTAGAYDTSFNGGNYDAFVSKLNAKGSALVFSTLLGGKSDDHGGGLGLDGAGNVYVTGITASTNFPTSANGYDRTQNGNEDAYLVKLVKNGSILRYGTFIGGRRLEWNPSIAIGKSDSIFLTGWTQSFNFPTSAGAFDRTHGGDKTCVFLDCNDAFVVRFR